MQLTIIEPHKHFESIIQLVPAIHSLTFPVSIICSRYSREQVLALHPEMASIVNWDTHKKPKFPKKNTVLLFTSLQYTRRPWLRWIRRFPTAVLISNTNYYLGNPISKWASPTETSYSSWRYSFEKHFRFRFTRKISQKILSEVKALIPHSSLQIPFLRTYYKGPIMDVPLLCKSQPIDIGNYDFIPVYRKTTYINIDYIQKIQGDLNPHSICLCLESEKKIMQQLLPQCEFMIGPVSHQTYIDLFKNARRVVFPFHREMNFGIVRELLGETKYLARIYTALMYDKPVLLPPDIPLPPAPPSETDFIAAFQELVAFLKES